MSLLFNLLTQNYTNAKIYLEVNDELKINKSKAMEEAKVMKSVISL